MKIENIRLGLATNSSSSHSIIFNLNAHSQDWENAEFGWNEFCCNCKDSKRMYLASVLYQNLQNQVGDDIARAVVESWAKTQLVSSDDYYGIDHQSLIDLPVNAQTGLPDKIFFKELMNAYLDPKLAIVGGNDNDDYVRFMDDRQDHLIPTDTGRTHICRQDVNTGHWALFNKNNGTKIRFHFDKNVPDYKKAFAPELIDCKIINYCPIGCDFCYQDSTPDGVHGNYNYIKSLIYYFAKMGVFEVAIGGGEPTMHPDFVDILKAFHDKGIVPNFTTRNYKWFSEEKIREAVKKYAGKFAVSVSNVQDVERSCKLANEFSVLKSFVGVQMGFQYVMGSTTLDEFKDLIQAIPYHCEMTLLGYKEVGRGTTYKPFNYDGWLEIIQDSTKKIGIDTSLALQYKEEILKSVNKQLVTFEEGKFSMYVDAVTQRAAPSSYCSEDQYVNMPNPHKINWEELFKKF
ncbi:MAG: radical SAM protein [Promethearchaeota archaeon]